MCNKQFLERKIINENTVQAIHTVGNSVYIVNSCFAGKEQLENLLFNIFHNKSMLNNKCRERA